MERDPKKLYVIIVWLSFLGLALLLIPINYWLENEEWKSIFNSIIANILSTLIILIVLYYFLKKELFEEDIRKTVLYEKEELIEAINEQTLEIDNKLLEVEEKVDKILSKKGASSWEEYYNILADLRGYWIEFIPKREQDSCEISIGNFNLDNHDKHEFLGTNYHTNTGEINYQWTTQKVLPPVRHDDQTIFIYYIYIRYNNQEYQDKYGFGKLVAKRDIYEPDKYSFTSGFFFNEATSGKGYYPMILIPLSIVEKFLGIEIKESMQDKVKMKKMFEELKSSNIYEKWREKNSSEQSAKRQ